MADPDHDRRDWVIMLSGSPWRVGAHRQQALAAQLAGPTRVLFVDPPVNRTDRRFAVTPVGESLWHATTPSLLPGGRQLPAVNRINRVQSAACLNRFLHAHPGRRLLWVDEDLAEPVIGRLGESAVIYDATDLDWTFTRRWNRWHLRRALGRAVAAADLVLASSSALPSRLPASRRPAVVLANGCDPDHFQPTGRLDPWLHRLPRPRLGYLGSLDTRAFDAPLVAALARDHPEWTIALVGPATRAGLAPLRGLSNVHIMGPVPYATAPDLVRGFDVGIIPYRVGGLIDYVHPKKCFEFLAAGKPVVATALPALVALGPPVRIATGPVRFAAAVTEALRENGSAARRYREVAVANSWPARADVLRAHLADLVPTNGVRL